mmetsp:Transcript_8928/g.26818  ORF Transcript_8928/g.26818 Transcript_8928/m.26818 type:complete len:253 (+) Transcript_8928:181-939(+)
MDALGDEKTRLKDLMRKRKQDMGSSRETASRPAPQVSRSAGARSTADVGSARKPDKVAAAKAAAGKSASAGALGLVAYGSDDGDDETDDDDDGNGGSADGEEQELPEGFFDAKPAAGTSQAMKARDVPPEPTADELEMEAELAELEEEVALEAEESKEEQEKIAVEDEDLADLHEVEEQQELEQRVTKLRQAALAVRQNHEHREAKDVAGTSAAHVPPSKLRRTDGEADAGGAEDSSSEDTSEDFDWRAKKF